MSEKPGGDLGLSSLLGTNGAFILQCQWRPHEEPDFTLPGHNEVLLYLYAGMELEKAYWGAPGWLSWLGDQLRLRS